MQEQTNDYIFNISKDPVKFVEALANVEPNVIYGFCHDRYKPTTDAYKKIGDKIKNTSTSLIFTDVRIQSVDIVSTEYYPSFYPGIHEHFLIHSPIFLLPNMSVDISHNPEIQLYFSHEFFIQLSNYYFPTHIPEPLFTFHANASDENSVRNDINIFHGTQSDSKSDGVLQTP